MSNLVGHDPRIVVNTMIEIAGRDGIALFNVSIQKLLYFAHASYLVHERKPLIRGSFEAWEFGPVCRPIYEELKAFGRTPVVSKIRRKDPMTGRVSDLDGLNDHSARLHLEQIMRSLGRAHPNQLITLSHVPGGAWSIVWNKGKTGPTMGNRIDDSLTRETFGKFKISLSQLSLDEEPTDEATPFAGN